MNDLKAAHERALRYCSEDSPVMRARIDRYLAFLEASGYVIAPLQATEEMRRLSFIWPSDSAKPYAEMIAARPRRGP